MTNATQYISTAEAAQLLRVSPRTIHRMVDAGKLTPATKAPGPRGAFLFRPEDIIPLVGAR